jgi:hypothetical protein
MQFKPDGVVFERCDDGNIDDCGTCRDTCTVVPVPQTGFIGTASITSNSPEHKFGLGDGVILVEFHYVVDVPPRPIPVPRFI